MASKAWSVGAWALEAEREDAEERDRAAAQAANPQSFPSLKEAAAAKPKKKKPVPIPLPQFAADSYSSAVPAAAAGRLTPDEMLRLPTGPKERTPEEFEYGRLGGGFRSYGAGGGGPRGGAGGFPSRRSDDADGGSWGGGGRRPYGGGFDDEQRRGLPARAAEFDQPSRADEVDNWAAGKKAMAPPGNYGQPDRYGSFGSGGMGGPSRADEVENWSFGKKPAVAAASRYPSFGSGFRDSSTGMDSGLWGGRGGGGGSLNGERPRLVLDPPKAGGDAAGTANEPARTRPSPFGAARPREEILAEKGVDWRKVDSEIEVKKTSRPTSSHSSRPSSAQSGRLGSPGSQEIEGAVRARPIVNPFGNAKPREVLLQEQGKDWRKIDMELEHRAVERPETNEEKVLKEEINQLKKKLTRASEGDLQSELAQSSADEVTRLREEMLHKEKELEQLMLQLDDKVRFGQKASSNMPRPSSGAGRSSVSSDSRPHSRSGMPEESRSMEFMERPRSRGGIGDVWAKPMDDRQGFQGAADRGFFGNRNLDRPRARERW